MGSVVVTIPCSFNKYATLLLCARCCSRGWEYSGEQDRVALCFVRPHLEGGKGQQGTTVLSDPMQLWGPGERSLIYSRGQGRLPGGGNILAEAQRSSRREGGEQKEAWGWGRREAGSWRSRESSGPSLVWEWGQSRRPSHIPFLQAKIQCPKSEQAQAHTLQPHCLVLFPCLWPCKNTRSFSGNFWSLSHLPHLGKGPPWLK